jgi:hypothetical protein
VTQLNFALDPRDYTLNSALFWGNFRGHCIKATQGKWGHRIVHLLIAVLELAPIVSQIISLFEMVIVRSCLYHPRRKKPRNTPVRTEIAKDKLNETVSNIVFPVIQQVPPVPHASTSTMTIPEEVLKDINDLTNGMPDNSGKTTPDSDLSTDSDEPKSVMPKTGSEILPESTKKSTVRRSSDSQVVVNTTASMQLERARLEHRQDQCLLM